MTPLVIDQKVREAAFRAVLFAACPARWLKTSQSWDAAARKEHEVKFGPVRVVFVFVFVIQDGVLYRQIYAGLDGAPNKVPLPAVMVPIAQCFGFSYRLQDCRPSPVAGQPPMPNDWQVAMYQEPVLHVCFQQRVGPVGYAL